MILQIVVHICKHMLINVFWKKITTMYVLYNGEIESNGKKSIFLNLIL